MTRQAAHANGAPYDDADAHLATSDTVMAGLVRRLGPVTLPDVGSPPDLLGALIMGVVRQQLSATSATAIYDRLLRYFGDRVPTPDELLSAGPDLRTTAGLSHAKERSLRALARRVKDGDLDLDQLPFQSDDEVLRSLTSVPGIGEWTAGVFMMFRLHRPDVVLAGDLGIRKAAQLAYGLDDLPPPRPSR